MTARQDLPQAAQIAPIDYQDRYSIPPRKSWLRRWFVRLLLIVGASALAAAILLPTMCKAREPANRIKCANDLRQIAMAAIMDAQARRGAFPASLQDLMTSQELPASIFDCPSDRNPATDSASTRPGPSYIYVGDGVKPDVDQPETAVIVFERLSNHSNDGMEIHLEALADHSGDGMNVAFADAHVEWIAAPDVGPILRQAAAGVRPIRFPPPAATQP